MSGNLNSSSLTCFNHARLCLVSGIFSALCSFRAQNFYTCSILLLSWDLANSFSFSSLPLNWSPNYVHGSLDGSLKKHNVIDRIMAPQRQTHPIPQKRWTCYLKWQKVFCRCDLVKDHLMEDCYLGGSNV